MLGHGHRASDDFRLDVFARDLYDTYFTDGLAPYNVIIGHSLGGTVALALLPLLSLKPTKTAVILVDPAIQFNDPVLDAFEVEVGSMVENVPSVETLAATHPKWTRQDVVSRIVGLHLAQSSALPKRIFEVSVRASGLVSFVACMLLPLSSSPRLQHIKPFAYGHLFDAIPPHVEMTVLIADPALSDVCPLELVPAHPQIRKVVTVKGSGHWIQHEDPEVIVRTAVDEVGRLRASSPNA
ncbi:hypothetical protein JVU11DRAFT_10241 [Chiua virens]|nr:hypothetical protein JVU11DRAFT_10241 [Chiua virens]